LVGLRRMLFNERAGFSPESTINIWKGALKQMLPVCLRAPFQMLIVET
jgi:hypothetical protein